jgi:hypothetical protein
MAGSPKKREREKAARLAAAEEKQETAGAQTPLAALAPQRPTQEVLDPLPQDVELTRTALKRAMRARAQEYAEKAIAVLAANLNNTDNKIAMDAANRLLEWGFGKPAQEIEAGEGLQIAIVKFNQDA